MEYKLLGNRYEIIEKIADGGMAFVYKAKCTLLNRIVAIKVLRHEFVNDEEFLQKFKNEAQAAASLTHPNIVNIYDVGQQDNIHYIVMEYVEGLNLKELIKKQGKLDYKTALDITKQIAVALSQAHKRHIIHRDIKPHNILISNEGIVKVADFGIAKATTSSTITCTGSVIGSVHYFSPEQARGGYVDEKSDLYSLGIVLFEMLTGRVPFKGDTPVNIALKHINDELVFPDEIKEDIPQSVIKLVDKLTQKSQVNRYQKSEDLIKDIESIQNNVEPSFDDDYTHYATQKIDLPKKRLVKQDKNLKLPKKNKKKITILAIILGLVLALTLTISAYFLKDFFVVKEYEVPDLENMHIDDAKELLEKMNLSLQIRREVYDATVDEDHIISQIPESGTKVKEGYIIKVDISKGGKIVTVPDLLNKRLDQANEILSENNLVEGIVRYEYSNLPEGTVIKQDPQPLTQVKEGSEINLIVSKGRQVRIIQVPNVIGKTLEQAKIDLKGLVIGNITTIEDTSMPNNVIVSQSLTSGQRVKEGTKINLTINRYNEEPKEKITTKRLTIKLPQDKETFNLIVNEIVDGKSTTIYNETINSSEYNGTISIQIQGSGKKEYEIYVDNQLYEKLQVQF
ncbi:serine/threonine protein kinase [Alkalithermobacter thermoalcaliphilus JW-YL-7 = DSM 7308]|uniref:non-specific serine/threonine protein kinase n=1 Tax=Alkalithermobacter thermoalcaliphilus JW-YL-7 = DSM 7308 TaxID=1121328 RepID=A0A150FQW4_CLOPD|nr:serine/threonine protein kinase with PASTA sensor(s) [[Clostridium] paradoxum JW-YL-7 = DSM 7308]SHK96262.1 serine/threonine protein kinase [[Clostridium] paradoxum JW-YL-7 = DSM 7308]